MSFMKVGVFIGAVVPEIKFPLQCILIPRIQFLIGSVAWVMMHTGGQTEVLGPFRHKRGSAHLAIISCRFQILVYDITTPEICLFFLFFKLITLLKICHQESSRK
jgi:hypothetical protein